MTSDVRIQVKIHCDRTGREQTQFVSLEQMRLRNIELNQKRINAEKIQAFMVGLEGPLPDLVVACNDGIVILENVVGTRGKSISRLLYELTRSNLFPKPTRCARNKKDKQIG